MSLQPSSCDRVLHVEIETDTYPSDTSFELIKESGDTLYASPNTLSASSVSTFEICLTISERYTFMLLDSFGDGICCEWGNGRLRLKIDNEDYFVDTNYTDFFSGTFEQSFTVYHAPSQQVSTHDISCSILICVSIKMITY